MAPKVEKVYTIQEIAEYAGVSRSTVSRVLNNVRTRVPVSAATRAKIQEAVRHFDYTPNENARRLSVNRSFVIGLQLPAGDAGHYVFSDYNLVGALQGVEAALQKTNYRLQLLFGSCMGDYSENVRLFKNKSLDGLLIWGALRDEIFSEDLGAYPVLMLNSLPARGDFPSIVHDDYTGSLEQAKDLIRAGAKKFLYVKGPDSVTISSERLNGFCDALRSAGLDPERCCDFYDGHFTYDSVSGKAAEVFRTPEKFAYDAVVCVNDTMATAFWDAAVFAGLTPQKDFFLAGADGSEDCARYDLITYRCDRFRMGQEAIEYIIRRIEGKEAHFTCRKLATAKVERKEWNV